LRPPYLEQFADPAANVITDDEEQPEVGWQSIAKTAIGFMLKESLSDVFLLEHRDVWHAADQWRIVLCGNVKSSLHDG
jgi:hypothetical protein